MCFQPGAEPIAIARRHLVPPPADSAFTSTNFRNDARASHACNSSHDLAAVITLLGGRSGATETNNTDQCQGTPRVITGHIDFLQVRNGAVHILDYKPDARTNKPIAQLAIYALALTRLVPGLKLFDIKCAWFNEEEYCEFFRAPYSSPPF